jgi:hypothetical protein
MRFWICAARLFLQAGLCFGAPQIAHPQKPRRAEGSYTSYDYALTFEAPDHATYCPLPHDFQGSDHGTIIFLRPPSNCGGAGYPSSDRAFEPADVPRIEVFYDFGAGISDRCNPAGSVSLFGTTTALCRDNSQGLASLSVIGHYGLDRSSTVEVSLTLITKRSELDKYIPQFWNVISSVKPCRAEWFDDLPGNKKRIIVNGHGSPCPAGDWL